MGSPRIGATLVALAVTLLTAGALADEAEEPKREWLAQPSTAPLPIAGREEGPSPWRIGAMFLLVGGLAAAAVYAKRVRAKGNALPNAPSLSIVGAARVGPKAQIVLASVSGKMLLVGVTDTSVRKLAWIDSEEQTPSLPKSKGASRFDDILGGLLPAKTEARPDDEWEDDDLDDEPAPPPAERPSPSPALDLALRMRDKYEASTPPRMAVSQESSRTAMQSQRRRDHGMDGQAQGLRRRKAKRS